MLNKFVVIDLETTGNLPKKGDKIIQFAAVVIEDGRITEKFSSLINPNKDIPAFIEELTGINDEMVRDAPIFSEVAPKIISLLEYGYFVAHNVLFDLSFLQEELIQAGFEGFYGHVLDTVELARILFPTADGYKLTDLAERENLLHERPHQADSDALVTAELLQILLERLSLLPKKLLEQLCILSGGLKSDVQQLIEDILLEKNKMIEEFRQSIEIYNGIALKKQCNSLNTHLNSEDLRYPANDEEKLEALKKAYGSFEKRPGQLQMMDEVYHSFQNSVHTLIEAGTGIGKSIGYLLPAAFFAKQKQLPVVVSTHTIQLQDQLINKEIPLLSKILPFKVNTVILKGRNHYISLEKFIQTLKDENDNYDTTLTKMQILIWLLETNTGDKDELNLSSGGLIYWNRIKNEQSTFNSDDWSEKDFYLRAMNSAEKADIIITNHSVLLSDLVGKRSILPHYDYGIIDEGHHFEKVATNFFGSSLDYLSIRLFLGQIGQYEQRQLFYKLEELFHSLPSENSSRNLTSELNQMISSLLYEMDEFFKIAGSIAKIKAPKYQSTHRLKIRLSLNNKTKETSALIHSAERFAFLLKDIIQCLHERIELIKIWEDSLPYEQKCLLENITIFTAKMEQLRVNVQALLLRDHHLVRWIEIDFRSPQNLTTIFAQPTSVSEPLGSEFFKAKKGIVITSATLTVNQSYEFIMKELGLEPDNTNLLTIPSPFDYKNQVQLLIPEDVPEIKSVSSDEYVLSITEHIITIAEATKGRMLILFTSHEMLRKTYDLIKECGFLDDYVIIGQGVTSGSRMRLTKNFQRYEKAILLGTSSFWEGVDIPGEDLSCLVIVRLPFSPPDEPYSEAKAEFVKLQGGNAFSDVSLPEAILRFKQGFGRLIRTESDRGIIVVFDKRIVTTQYGKAFLKSIPQVPLKVGPMDELVEVIQTWL